MNQTKHEELRLTDKRDYFRPFRYPQFYEMANAHVDLNWGRREVRTLDQDQMDYASMSEEHKRPIEASLLYFTQMDVDVAAGYFANFAKHYGGHPEIMMWAARVVDREATHVDTYSMLPEQLGIEPKLYEEFNKIEQIKNQRMFMLQPTDTDFWGRISNAAKHIVGEGIGIYGLFLHLVNYSIHGQFKALGQEIISWSARDENDHVNGWTELFKIDVQENPGKLGHAEIEALRAMFCIGTDSAIEVLKYIFSLGKVEHLTIDEVIMTLKQIANRRYELLEIDNVPLYEEVVGLPLLPQLKVLFNGSEHVNFFETSNTAYGFYSGEWEYPTEEIIPDYMYDTIVNG